jgi:hypothetical protein
MAWQQETNIRGPAGQTGAAGPPGADSTVPGPQGAAGPANVLTVESTTTGAPGSNANVSISGTSPAQALAFTIPRGDVGAQGAPGTTDWNALTNKPATFPPTLPIAESDVTNLVTDLAAKAPLASPALTGNPTAPTPATEDNDTSIATTAFCKTAINAAIATATVAALKALDTTTVTNAHLIEPGKDGQFVWRPGDYTAQVAADINEGIYVKSDSVPASAGAWVRQRDDSSALASWFGYAADYNSITGSGRENGAILESALALVGVSVVYCPTGRAKVDKVEIPKGKSVIGERIQFQTFLDATYKPDAITGTVWVTRQAATMASGRPTNEIVRLNRGSLLADLMIFYDAQPTPAGAGWTPIDTPWAVRAGRFADNSRDVRAEHAAMQGIFVLAFSHCIEFQKGGEGGYIRDCAWHGFKIGLSLDNIHHLIMLDNVEAYPYWGVPAEVTIYMLNNYVAYEFGRVDGLRVSGGLFSIYANVGVGFIPSRSTDFPGEPAYFFDIDAIYSDSSTHGMMVYPSITGAPLTGHIGHLIQQRTGVTGLTVAAASDYGVRLRGLCDISIGKFESSGSGFSRPGGHMQASVAGCKMTINQARICEWDTDSLGKPAFSFGVAGSRLQVSDPIEVFTGAGTWWVTTKRIFSGQAPDAASKAVTINSTNQTLRASYPVRLIAAGFREYRVRGRVGTHPTATNVTVSFIGTTAIAAMMSCPASGSTADVDGIWKTINLSPDSEVEAGPLVAMGVPGDATLTFLRLGIELR